MVDEIFEEMFSKIPVREELEAQERIVYQGHIGSFVEEFAAIAEKALIKPVAIPKEIIDADGYECDLHQQKFFQALKSRGRAVSHDGPKYYIHAPSLAVPGLDLDQDFS